VWRGRAARAAVALLSVLLPVPLPALLPVPRYLCLGSRTAITSTAREVAAATSAIQNIA